MIVVVKRRKDRKAVESIGNDLKVLTPEEAENVLDFKIYLYGREEKVEAKEDVLTKIAVVSKSKIRHTRLNEIRDKIEEAKFRFLLDVYLENDYYIFGKRSNILEIIPGSDLLILPKNYYGVELNEFPLVQHTYEKDYIFSPKLCYIFDRINIKIEKVGEVGEIDKKKSIKSLEDCLNKKIEVVREKIKGLKVVVPWSGGKDSTFLLSLAKKFCKEVFAVYVRTEKRDPNLEYLERVSKKIGIKYEVVDASFIEDKISEEYLKKRLCAHDKISSLYNFIKKNFDKEYYILVADRICESRDRSLRPEISFEEGFYHLRPIKYFSSAEIFYYFSEEGIPINDLYLEGFYRIGCSFCPFIDPFEKKVLQKLFKGSF